jgi:tetratricopeptide (TPR) repeat protein
MMLARILWTAGRTEAGDAALRRGIAHQLARGDSAAALREDIALATAMAWRNEDASRVRSHLEATLAAVPLATLAVLDRPYLELATVQALAGQTREARATLEDFERLVPAEARHRQAGTAALARGTVAFVERRLADATDELSQAATSDCQACGLAELGLVYEAQGRRESAAQAYRAFLEAPTLRRTDVLDALHRRWVMQRLAALERRSCIAAPEPIRPIVPCP